MGEARAGSPAIALESVSVRYKGRETLALDGVSLIARAGEVTAVLGANGAGKSTLLRVVAGLLAPDRGTLTLGGVDARTLDRRAMARVVALVPQIERVAEGFRVREVVGMGRSPHLDGWMRPRREDETAVDDAMARCDLVHLADRDVATLSGGEHRRVAIARALAQRPKVLALDEPAAFLDIKHRLALREVLADAAKRDGVACVAALHDLEDAARLASHVVILRGGKVLAAGAPADVMTRELLATAFDVSPTSLDVPAARAPSRS
ncbi:MAG TPA: ABC transporter ATP-binding protein [Polyangiaceae bacterium]